MDAVSRDCRAESGPLLKEGSLGVGTFVPISQNTSDETGPIGGAHRGFPFEYRYLGPTSEDWSLTCDRSQFSRRLNCIARSGSWLLYCDFSQLLRQFLDRRFIELASFNCAVILHLQLLRIDDNYACLFRDSEFCLAVCNGDV